MIHYHGLPITPVDAAASFLARRHAWCPMGHASQTALAFEVCQSAVLECNAFSLWRSGGGVVDVDAYADYVREWERHPAFDFAVVPDQIDGSELDNNRLIAKWLCDAKMRCRSAPVWHLHESLERLDRLIRDTEAGVYDRVCLGSSGQWDTPGTNAWWERMEEVRVVACDDDGRPRCRLHGLRMLAPTIFSHIPFASADSTNVAQNINIDKKWGGPYPPVTPKTRALVLAERIEMHVAAVTWSKRCGVQQNLELIG